MDNIQLKLRRGMPGIMNRKINRKQNMNLAVRKEYKRTTEKKMRETIKQPFANIESEWEKVKRAIWKDSKEMLGYAKRAIPVQGLSAETINLA